MFYFEGDEILHENDLLEIRGVMERYFYVPEGNSQLFDYNYFYGDLSWLANRTVLYMRECCIISNVLRNWMPDVYFVVMDANRQGRYSKVALVNALIYYYGYVHNIVVMQDKNQCIGKYWKHNPLFFNGYQLDLLVLLIFLQWGA